MTPEQEAELSRKFVYAQKQSIAEHLGGKGLLTKEIESILDELVDLSDQLVSRIGSEGLDEYIETWREDFRSKSTSLLQEILKAKK